jgi:predicted ATPase
MTPLIGRERQVEEVGTLLRRGDVRLVTLTGAGGMGKTRLALQVAADLIEEFLNGVFFVSLAPIRDPELVIPTIAQTLGIREMSGDPLMVTLNEYLRDKQLLLVLDNFEQVVVAAPSVASLLISAPELKLLVTSRTPLHLSGERSYEVPPLSLPDPNRLPELETLTQYEAVALFLERAQSAKTSFAITNENAPAVAEICVRLDGLPLALELAAARVRALPPQTLLARLDQRLKLLTGGPEDLDERQRTLRATIAWSYQLLSDEEKTLFSRLSVFVGGCRLDAAEAVCNLGDEPEIDLVDGLTSLVEKNLVRQKEDPDGEPRYWMLETIREYGLDQQANLREAQELRGRHADYFVEIAERTRKPISGVEQAAWFARLEDEHDNLRAAVSWLLAQRNGEQAIRAVSGLWIFWKNRGHGREGARWGEEALSITQEISPQWRAEGATDVGELLRYLGDYDRATALKREALDLYKSLGDQGSAAATLHDLGEIAFVQRDYGSARELHEQSLALREKIGNPLGIAHALSGLGDLALEEGHYARADEIFSQILDAGRAEDDPEFVLSGLGGLGETARRSGDLDRAYSLFCEALAFAWEAGNLHQTMWFLDSLARVRAAIGDPVGAAHLWGASEAVRETTGFAVWDTWEYERCLADARTKASEAEFEHAWTSGRAIETAEAIAFALEEKAAPVSPHQPAG